MTQYLLETNVVHELRKRVPHGAVVAWLETLRVEQILISSATMGELQTGVELTRKQDPEEARALESCLVSGETCFVFVPMDARCFREWSRLMNGKPDAMRDDAMIAATARAHGLTVATRNEKDFKRLGVEIVNPFRFH